MREETVPRPLKPHKLAFPTLAAIGMCVLTLYPNQTLADSECGTEKGPGSKYDTEPINYTGFAITVESIYADEVYLGDCVDVIYMPIHKGKPVDKVYFVMTARVTHLRDGNFGKSLVDIEVSFDDFKRLTIAQSRGFLSISPVNVDGGEYIDCASGALSDACFMGPAWLDGSG